MVLVPVRDEERLETTRVLSEVAEVGDDDVDAEVFVVGEHQTAIDGDRLIVNLVQHHIATDVAEAAEWDDSECLLGSGGSCHSRGS